LSPNFKILVGFDGFTDSIYHVVEERKNADETSFFSSIPSFARRLEKAANVSCNIELVLETTRLGGNAPLMAKALLDKGASINFIGTIGEPQIESVFADFASNCSHVISLGPSGKSDALEFQDGKIILGKHDSILHINEKTLLSKAGSLLKTLWEESDLIAMVNWTMFPSMNAIWHYLQTTYNPTGKLFFFDLADPSKRQPADLKEALRLIARFDRSILGLNESEAAQIKALVGPDFPHNMGISEIVVHSKTSSLVYAEKSSFEVKTALIQNPVTLTGAGDNFNAGYCFARLQKKDYKASLEEACEAARRYITKT